MSSTLVVGVVQVYIYTRSQCEHDRFIIYYTLIIISPGELYAIN